ncbi:MAG: hypothetical protein QGH40_02405, partial [bacterium]|nr:hypothetical protein [bacterium]
KFDALETFASCQYVRKCKHLVGKHIDTVSVTVAKKTIENTVGKLKRHLETIKDEKYHKFLTLEIKELTAFTVRLMEK